MDVFAKLLMDKEKVELHFLSLCYCHDTSREKLKFICTSPLRPCGMSFKTVERLTSHIGENHALDGKVKIITYAQLIDRVSYKFGMELKSAYLCPFASKGCKVISANQTKHKEHIRNHIKQKTANGAKKEICFHNVIFLRDLIL